MTYKDIKVGDVYDCWQVLREPERINDYRIYYCWCRCVECQKVEKYVRCNDLLNRTSHCVCQRKKKYNITKPQKLKTISYKKWCDDNNRQDLLDRWDYELNKYTPDSVAYMSQYRIYFKCPKGLHKSKDLILQSITNCNNPCNCDECYLMEYSFGKWCEKHYSKLLDLWDYDKNIISPYQVKFMSQQKFYFKCERGIHDSYTHIIANIVNNRASCSCNKCNSIGQWIIDNYDEEYLYVIWDYHKNTKLPFDISRGSSRQKIFLKCLNNPNHGSYPISPSNYIKGRGCPICKQERTESKLQEKVRKYIINKYHYDIVHEYACDLKPINPKTNYVLPYDNQITLDNGIKIIIEVMGIQHYQVTGYTKSEAEKHGITPEDELKYLQWRDEYKRQYAVSHGYRYIAIPSTAEYDESYKTLIDNKIHEILTLTQQND